MEANVEVTQAEYLVTAVVRAEEGFDEFREAAEHDVDLSIVASAYGEASAEVAPQPQLPVAQQPYSLALDWKTLVPGQQGQASAAIALADEIAADTSEGATS